MRLLITACLAACSTLGAFGCKPADEPPRRGHQEDAIGSLFAGRDVGVPAPSGTVLVDRHATATPPVVGELVEGERADGRVEDVDTPDVAAADDTADAVDVVEVEVEVGPEDSAGGDGEPPPWVVLPDDLIARVRAPASERDQEDARRFNRTGLGKHRRLELDAAIRDYRQALDAWPGHPFSNYNLACAYALTARPDDALRHLAILAAVESETARERLITARLDPDFDALVDDPRFRGLTGYAPVWVSWAPSVPRRAEAERLAKALQAVKVPARVTPMAWAEEVEVPTLFVRADDPLAQAMAREVRAAVTVSDLAPIEANAAGSRRLVEVARADLDAARSLVLVLPGRPQEPPAPDPTPAQPDDDARAPAGDDGGPSIGRPPAPDEAVVGVRGEARAFADLVGTRLVASDGGAVSKLEFKPTGFFSWEIVDGSGARTLRRGRYALRGDSLALTYREDREVPGSDPSAPEVSYEENKQTVHPFTVGPDGLTLDGTSYLVR